MLELECVTIHYFRVGSLKDKHKKKLGTAIELR